MSEPSYLSGDPFSNSNNSDGIQEVECAECGQLAEVPTTEEHSHGETTTLTSPISLCWRDNVPV